MIKAIVIDDEKSARENLCYILSKFFSQKIQVIGEADSVEAGKKILSEKQCDLIFLDINLSDGNGFNILEEINEINFEIIFVTAYNHFAIKAFRVNALDYILKPVNVHELAEAIWRAGNGQRFRKADISIIAQNLRISREDQKLVVKESSSISFLPVSEIIRCKSDNNYTEIYLTSGERIVSGKTLKEYEQILSGFGFFRVHQSHLINICKVKKILNENGFFALMENGDMIEISRRRRDEFTTEMYRMVVK